MALLIFHSSCIGYVLSLARMGLFHGTFKLRLLNCAPMPPAGNFFPDLLIVM